MVRYAFSGIVGILVVLILAACTNSQQTSMPVEDGQGLGRPDVPSEFAGLTSPKMNASDIEAGKKVYQINCTSCHGEKGLGDGPASVSLSPKPEPLAKNVGMLSDDYLYWRISQGGIMEPFKSAMPAWSTILKDSQIWQVISYLRTLEE